MELEVESLTGAAYGEKSPEHLAQRNGYRDRSWEPHASWIESNAWCPRLRVAMSLFGSLVEVKDLGFALASSA